jgi:ATP-binding cassette, subfamily C (CFTR/MRP), member 1
MPVPQPTSALTAAEQHREQQDQESVGATAAGDEKLAFSKINDTSSRTSSISTTEHSPGQDASGKGGAQKRKWYQKLNPLRLRKIPPVPEKRSVSPEYGAGILSVILFQWMSPLMNVSDLLKPLRQHLN